MSSPVPTRSEQDLTNEERHQLELAHRELRAAVEAYEAFLGRQLEPGVELPVVDAEELRAAQERVEFGSAPFGTCVNGSSVGRAPPGHRLRRS